MKKKASKFRIHVPDNLLFLSLIGLLGMGFLALSSAAGGAFLLKQSIFLVISLALVSVSYYLFDFHFFERYAKVFYFLNIGLLILVKFLGATALGAQRWIRLGPISVQPSEIAKICIIIALAAWLARRPIKSYWDIFLTLCIVAVPAGLVFIQPDLGTTLVFIAITLGMLFWAGAKLAQLIILVSPLLTAIFSAMGEKLFVYDHPTFGFAITLPVVIFFVVLLLITAWHYKVWQSPWRTSGLFLFMGFHSMIMIVRPILWGLLKDYQQKRITIFLDPAQDPLGAGYHIIQSLYAVGGGGFMGRGMKSGELTQGSFVPEQHTDFIFSVIGEEFGFIGSMFLIWLFAVLCIRIIRIARKADDLFISLMLVGVFSMFIFHIFINIGMNLSIMPITGVPLPFMSYGGTSLLVDLFLMSLVVKAAAQKEQDTYLFSKQ